MKIFRLLLAMAVVPFYAQAAQVLVASEAVVIAKKSSVVNVLAAEQNVAGTECVLAFKAKPVGLKIAKNAQFEVLSISDAEASVNERLLLEEILKTRGKTAHDNAYKILLSNATLPERLARLEQETGVSAEMILSRTVSLKSAKTGAKLTLQCLFANPQSSSIDDLLLSLYEGGKLKPVEL